MNSFDFQICFSANSYQFLYRKTAMNFNPPMCKAGKICIAEVEEIVDIDEIPPGQVIIFVKGSMIIFCFHV